MPNHFSAALIGYTGFVGTTLLKQTNFTHLFRSINIEEIANQHFNLVVCAGAPAQKWLANKNPNNDFQNIKQLISYLETINCDRFVLVSTVDVFKNPIRVDENSHIDEISLHPYGLHRRMLEKFVIERFNNHHIIRLPGLVGPGLRKNVIFDLLNQNNLHSINSQNIFQFYPMTYLWSDIQTAIRMNLPIIHLTSEPLSVETVAKEGFGLEFQQKIPGSSVSYDMCSIHDTLFGGCNGYQYDKQAIIQAIQDYVQSEPKTLISVAKV